MTQGECRSIHTGTGRSMPASSFAAARYSGPRLCKFAAVPVNLHVHAAAFVHVLQTCLHGCCGVLVQAARGVCACYVWGKWKRKAFGGWGGGLELWFLNTPGSGRTKALKHSGERVSLAPCKTHSRFQADTGRAPGESTSAWGACWICMGRRKQDGRATVKLHEDERVALHEAVEVVGGQNVHLCRQVRCCQVAASPAHFHCGGCWSAEALRV